jgi:hypothetical protein
MTTYRLEPFDGTTPAAEFIRNFEALSASWTEEEKLARFSQYLKGAAAHWLEFMRNGGTLRNKLFANYDDKRWTELRTAFLKQFHKNYGIEWYVTVQGTEELGLEFFFRMLNVYGAQEELSYKDSGLTEILVSKLNSSYLGKVKVQRPRKLEELKEVLEAIDDEHKREKSDISNRKDDGINSKMKSKNKLSRRLCYKCRKRGHIARNCKLERKKND